MNARTDPLFSSAAAVAACGAALAVLLPVFLAALPHAEPLDPAQKKPAAACTVSGTVVWPAERPRDPGDRVKARFFGPIERKELFETAAWHQDVPVDADGRFEAQIPGGSPASLSILVARAETRDFLFADVARVSCDGDVTVDLREAPSLAGRATDDEGRPLARVRLTAQQGSDELPNAARELLQTTLACDEKGIFRVPVCADGAWHVVADADGHAPSEVRIVTLPRDEPLELVLPRGGTIAGRVVDADGSGVADRFVRALPKKARTAYFGVGTRSTKTDAEGRFTLEGTAVGEVEVVVQADAASPRLTVEVAPGGRVDDVVVTIGG